LASKRVRVLPVASARSQVVLGFAVLKELAGSSPRCSMHRTYLITSMVAVPTLVLAYHGHITFWEYAAVVFSLGVVCYGTDRYLCRLRRKVK